MKRALDLFLLVLSLPICILAVIIIALAVKFTSPGDVIFWSDRIGVNNVIFRMPKFRTMNTSTPQVATHLLENPDTYYTSLGKFLRKYSLDELPQLISVLKGDMSFVGPRPALFNQNDLIELRTHNEIHKLKPGITGWAQVNGRDELTIPEKVNFEIEYMHKENLILDIYILWLTLLKVFKKEDISH